jgi:hypothetical protein
VQNRDEDLRGVSARSMADEGNARSAGYS